MKYLLTIVSLVFSSILLAQDVNMQTATVSQCGGVFYDSGGEFGNYGNDEDFILTICPENAGQKIRLDFTSFTTQLNLDVMSIFNGDSVAAPPFGNFSGPTGPGIVEATPDNASGCITIQFVSNDSGPGNGWAATISCLTPCQTINSQLDSSSPAPNGDGYIRVCPNEDVTLTGSGVFSVDGTGATYEWDLGDGNTATGQTATFSYATPGVYIVNLNIRDANTSQDPEGCTNNNLINQVIQVATEPDFTGTAAADPTICFGDSTTIEGVVNAVEFINDCTPPVSGITFLPDGNGVTYETSVTVDCYDSAQTITDVNQIVSICLNMEHSYLGDLDIEIISPSGLVVRMHDQGGGSANLGIPWATNPVDGNSGNTTPGTGYDYCFVPNGGFPTLVGGIQTGGTFPDGNGPGTYNDSFVPAGSYSSVNPLDGLIGSPLNGDWTIRVVDNIGADNGHIFSWSIEFDPNLQPPELSFTPVITSEAWDPDPTITNTAGNVITVTPPTQGQFCYTYRVTDDFGCEYTEVVCIDVLPEIVTEVPNNLFICDTGMPPYLFDLETNTAVVLASSTIPADMVVTYHNSQADADADTGEITDLNNYSGTDGETIYIRVEYLNSGCYEVLPFTLNVAGQPDINPVPDLVLCDDPSNDGFEEFDLDVQRLGILGGQADSDFNVTYHLNFADADGDTGALPLLYTNTVNPQPIYVRVESIGDSNCYNATATPLFNLVVDPRDDASFTVTPTCDGATVTINGAVGGTFTFNPIPTDTAVINPNTGEVTGGTSGETYGIEYTTNGVCPATSLQTFEVIVGDDPAFTVTPTCDGGTATITGDVGGTFSFNPAPTDTAVIDPNTGTVTDATPGNSYTIEYMTSGACPASSTEVLTVLTLDDPSFTLTATCDGATATVTGDVGGTFAFNPMPTDTAIIDANTGTITNGVSGSTYTVEYTTAGDCPQSSTQSVTVITSDDASFNVTPTCDGGTVTITGTTGGTFSFDVAPTDTAVINPATGDVTNGSPGASYSISYTTGGTCPDTQIVTFNALPIDDASFTVQPTCDGGTVTITGDVGGTFSFDIAPTDTAVINPATGDVTNGTPGETYSIEYVTSGTCPNSSIVQFTANPLPALVVPTPLEVCDDGTPDGLTEIDLSIKNIEITGNNPGYTVNYYLTQADADNAANPLTIPYTNISNPQIIFVRVEDNTTGCYDTTTLELGVEQAPVANTPEPLRYCDPDNDGFGMFTLTDAENDITIGAAGLTVTYHETMANADNNVDAIDTTVDYNNIVINTQTLYARVESETIATDCATIVELVLIVEPSPQIVEPNPLHACDDASADGYAMFDLTTKAPEVLNGLDPMQYTVSYYETEADANAPMNPIANPNAYTNTQEDGQFIWIRVEDSNTVEGCYKVTSLELIVNPLPVLLQPSPLELCDVDNPGDEQEPFTLEDANAEILNGQTGITLTYYETQLDADNGTSPIASPYINTSNAQTIYIRGENDNTGCYSTVTLTLRVNPLPSPEQDPEPIEVCDDDNDGFAEFDLTIRTVAITNGESDVVISYHETQEDAEMGDNPLSSPYTNIVANSQMIYVRSESTLTGCYRLTLNTLELVVVASPEVPTSLDPLIICDADADGIAQFDLTERDADILGVQNPADVTLTYHVNAADAQSGNNPIINVGNYTNTGNPQTIYVRLYNPTSDCYDTGEFELQVELPPTAVQPTPLELCDDLGESPGNEMTEFDLTVKDQEITGGNASWSVAYYETNADAQAQTGAIPDPTAYTNTSVGGLPANPQTLYVVVTDTDTGCVDYTTLTIRVLPNPTPTPSDQLPDLELCDEINTGDGFEIFDLTENEVLLLNGENGVTATYHETPEDSDSGMNAIVDPTQYTNIETPEQTIYVRVTNDVTGCYTLVDFTIRVNPLPEVVAVTDFIQCELNTDGFDSFDLTTKDEEVLNGQDPTQFIVTYHEDLADAESGMNALVSPYINTTNPQQIFVTITNNVTGCSISTQSFNIQVDEAAEANPDMDPILYEECDDHMETDGDPSNDSVQFDLSTQDAQVLDGQNPTDYIVSYYATEEDANLNVNPLPNLYENVVNPQVIYARVDNNTLTVIPISLDLAELTAGLDLDANGTIDTYDTDADGIFDLIDVDGDGLSDGIDANADGTFEYVDIDGDGNGDPVDLNNDGTFDNQADSSICFAVAELTLQVNPLPNFDLDDNYILCVNTNGTEILDPLVLDTELSEADYTFEWSLDGNVLAGGTGSSLSPLQGGTYSVIVTDISTSTVTQCVNMDNTVVTESEPPTLVADVVTQAFANNHVIEAVASGPGVYEYSLDGGPWQDEGIFYNVSTGDHEVTARDKNGCGWVSVPVFVIDYPLYFTPNGDGNHDTWNIKGIGSSAKIYIFDRYGKLLKQLSPTGPGWDGTFNGNRMPSNGYWFTVEYDEPLTGKRKEFKAHFTLKR
ncbi:T9SS type B sorting domain-containing protein [Winogradskyella pulchriflava]|uniref:T9SS type B sorting domain-containing protein n=1 Tax=Winogradskyella pulchriflava TaxID=1110688 RepID=A0ABV6Q6P4_9FLAO